MSQQQRLPHNASHAKWELLILQPDRLYGLSFEVVVSPTGMLHAEVLVKIVHAIGSFLDDPPIGKVYGAITGLIFPNGLPIAFEASTIHCKGHD